MSGQDCTNCQYAKLAEKLEEKYEDHDKRIREIERRQDVSDEKFKQVFEKLDEIIDILKQNQSRLPNLVWGVAGSATGGVVVWLIMQAIQK